MKYLISIYLNPKSREVWEGFSDAQRAEGFRAHAALAEDITESGEMIMTEALADPSQGKRVSVRDGHAITSDGPFAEAKEYLAGFYLIECESIDRAIERAAQIPEAAADTLIEVRPLLVRGGQEM